MSERRQALRFSSEYEDDVYDTDERTIQSEKGSLAAILDKWHICDVVVKSDGIVHFILDIRSMDNKNEIEGLLREHKSMRYSIVEVNHYMPPKNGFPHKIQQITLAIERKPFPYHVSAGSCLTRKLLYIPLSLIVLYFAYIIHQLYFM